jgi:hypothetical protein
MKPKTKKKIKRDRWKVAYQDALNNYHALSHLWPTLQLNPSDVFNVLKCLSPKGKNRREE